MRLLVIALLACMVMAVPVWGAPLELDISPYTVTAFPGDTVIYNLTIHNNQNVTDSFEMRFDGPRVEWKLPNDVLIPVDKESSKTVELIFNPAAEKGPHGFSVTVYSLTEPTILDSVEFNLNVELPPPLEISSLSIQSSETIATPTLEVETNREIPVYAAFSLKDYSGKILNTLTASATVDGTHSFSKTFSLEGLAPGTYTITAEANDLEESNQFQVAGVANVVESSERVPGILEEAFVVTLYNNGNKAETGYEVNMFVPQGDFITGFSIEPTSCRAAEGGQDCLFIVPNINPGEELKISYRLQFWPSYAKIIVSLVIVGLFGFFYMKRISHPKLRKIQRRKDRETHHVILEIKAPNYKKLKNVIIRDWVSPLATVMVNELKHVKPIINKSDAGVELIWRLGDMAKKEERILSYKIKTLVQGELKMPKAYLRFRDNKGERVRVYSKSIIVS